MPKRRIVASLRERRPIWDAPPWAQEEIRAALPADWELVSLAFAADGRQTVVGTRSMTVSPQDSAWRGDAPCPFSRVLRRTIIGAPDPVLKHEPAMRSPAAIAAFRLSAVLVVAAACAAPANPRPDAAAADPADPSIVWDYRRVTVVPELLDKREMASAIGRSYPSGLRAQGVTGAVTLELVTSREGVVESVSVLNASDPQFGDAARQVAVRMRFRPASVRGIPVRCRFTLPIRFDLQR